jgi:hypothetical protein
VELDKTDRGKNGQYNHNTDAKTNTAFFDVSFLDSAIYVYVYA